MKRVLVAALALVPLMGLAGLHALDDNSPAAQTRNVSVQATATAVYTSARLACYSSRRLMQVGHSIADGTTYDAFKFVGDGQRQSLIPTLSDMGKTLRCVGQYTNGSIIGCPYTDALGGATPGTISGILFTRIPTVLPTPTANDVILVGPMMKNGLADYATTKAFFLWNLTTTATLTASGNPTIFGVSEPLFNDGSNLTTTNLAISDACDAARALGWTNVHYLHIYDCMVASDIGGDNLHPTTPGYIKLGICMANRMAPYL